MKLERELSDDVDLCLADGRLNPAAVGWSRRPLHRCNVHGRWPRKKRWNYWAITNERYLFSATISHLDYAGLVFVYFADFQTGQLTEVTKLLPFGWGCELAETVAADARYVGVGVRVAMEQRAAGVALTVEMADFEGRPLVAQFDIAVPPQHESLNVVVPWDERTFQFTSKQNCLPTTGVVRLGSEEIVFAGPTFACLDLGRGIWPRHCRWNWGSGSGWQNGRLVGINLGGQWTDGTGSTENGVCVDGRLHKISADVRWTYDKGDWQRPWGMQDEAGRLALTFTPFLERVAASNVGLVRSEVHQLFGHYDGFITTDEGEQLAIRQLVGWAEDHVAVW